MILGEHGLALLDQFHLRALRLEALDAAMQQPLAAAHADGLAELAVGQIPEAVFIAVDAHVALGAAVIGSHFVIGDGPLAEIARPEAQAVSGPAEGPPAYGFQPAVLGPVSDRREMVALAAAERGVEHE